MKKIIIVMLGVLLMSACQKGKTFTVEGTIEGAQACLP